MAQPAFLHADKLIPLDVFSSVRLTAAMTAAVPTLLAQAQAAHAKGDVAAAAQGYAAALSADPEDLGARQGLGMLASQRGEHGAALAQFLVTVALAPARATVLNNAAFAAQTAGQVTLAARLFDWLTRANPADLAARAARAGLLVETGRRAEALAIYRELAALGVREPAILYNYAVLLRADGDADQALTIVENLTHRHPDFLEGHRFAGSIRRDRRDYAGAEAAYRAALNREPADPDSWSALALCFLRQDEHRLGRAAYRNALMYAPNRADMWNDFGNCLVAGEPEAARRVFGRVLTLDPGVGNARVLISALTDGKLANHPLDYVERLFNDYAPVFDQELYGKMAYRGPEFCLTALARLTTPPAAGWTIGDLGVGTGAAGPLLKPWAAWLAGIDLAQRMLDEAAKRGLYDELTRAEIAAYLNDRPGRFDLLIAADVLIYVGDSASLFEAAARALKPGGYFTFTTERLEDGDGLRLKLNGRYGHSRTYIEGLARDHGLTIAACDHISVRLEEGKPLPSDAWVLQKPGAQG